MAQRYEKKRLPNVYLLFRFGKCANLGVSCGRGACEGGVTFSRRCAPYGLTEASAWLRFVTGMRFSVKTGVLTPMRFAPQPRKLFIDLC